MLYSADTTVCQDCIGWNIEKSLDNQRYSFGDFRFNILISTSTTRAVIGNIGYDQRLKPDLT